jgi:hypothetical protein
MVVDAGWPGGLRGERAGPPRVTAGSYKAPGPKRLGRTVGTVTRLLLQLEVVGCPTVCRHCWAQGVPYPAMPLDDVARVLAQAHAFCGEHGLGFAAYPMHEVAAHPQAAQILGLFAEHVGAAEFEPLATTGVPLATRADWRELLAAASRLGMTTVWVAFHGLGAEHDRQVNRSGAYAETCLAIQRVHASGLRAGCNIFLTKANAPQAERLLGALQRLQVDGMWWGPADYYPTPRARRSEPLRPRPSDLRPLATQIPRVSLFDHAVWGDLEGHTEAAWMGRALAGDWPETPSHDGQVLELVCRPNLDVHSGTAGWYASSTATCAATARRSCSAERWPRAAGLPTRCGSTWTRRLAWPSWLPGTATPTGRQCTSPPDRFAISGWTGRSVLGTAKAAGPCP